MTVLSVFNFQIMFIFKYHMCNNYPQKWVKNYFRGREKCFLKITLRLSYSFWWIFWYVNIIIWYILEKFLWSWKNDDFLKNDFLETGWSITLFYLEQITKNFQDFLNYMICVHCSGILTFWYVVWKLEALTYWFSWLI